jgi:AraC-like DNA-binding protein
VLLTARAAPEDRLLGLEYEADDYLTKPFRAEELLARTANLIASRSRFRDRLSDPPLSLHAEPVEARSADSRFLEQVRTAIEANLGDETYTVQRLARDVAQSRSHLYRRLRDLLDESPSDLIRRIRLERAAQLLAVGAGSISSIAYSVGFKSVSHFSNRFRDAYGVRPSDYGRRNGG